MSKKGERTNEEGLSSGLFADRDALVGRSGKIIPEELNASLLWAVVVCLASRSASIQIGVTRDGGAWAVQYWDGKFPIKDYYNNSHELNRSFAALLRAAYKRDLAPELEEIVREYGW